MPLAITEYLGGVRRARGWEPLARSEQASAPATTGERGGLRAGLSRNVLVLGVASLFTDIGTEMIAPIRILFLVLILGAPIPIAGLIEGIAESSAALLKVWSGRLADRLERRRPLIVAGYGLSGAAKPLLALVTSWPQVLALVVLDRLGKGIRGSPRDALLADSTPAAYRGKAFGFHRALDTLGGAIGPLLALYILVLHGQEPRGPTLVDAVVFRQIFAVTAIPGALAVLVLLAFLRERRRQRAEHAAPVAPGVPVAAVPLAALGRPFWLFTGIATLFALGNPSDAFFFLRAISLESWLEGLPLVYFGYNMVYAALATPFGMVSDRIGRLPLLLAAYLAFALVYLGWSLAGSGWQIYPLFLLYGVYAAAGEGVARALVVDLAPGARRGQALGWFNGLTGLATLPANLLAGWIWSLYGPGSTFLLSAVVASVAACLLLANARRIAPARVRAQA